MIAETYQITDFIHSIFPLFQELCGRLQSDKPYVINRRKSRNSLQFIDEDPKTAEILTKIIFFAEDDKIKDPSILNQIK